MRIYTVDRPYLLTFAASGHQYPLTAEEAQRLLDEYPMVRYSRNRVVLQGHNSRHAHDRTAITPATLGGAAFVVVR